MVGAATNCYYSSLTNSLTSLTASFLQRNTFNWIDYKQVEPKAKASSCFSHLSLLTFDPCAAKETARPTRHDPGVVTRQVKTEATHLWLHIRDGQLACQGCLEDWKSEVIVCSEVETWWSLLWRGSQVQKAVPKNMFLFHPTTQDGL